MISLQWRHNGRDSVSNHQPHDCLLNRLFKLRSKKTTKLRTTGLCAGNSPGTGEFPAQMASYTKNVSIWWCHRVTISVVSNVAAHTQNAIAVCIENVSTVLKVDFSGDATGILLENRSVHYNDVIMGKLASQITSLTVVYSIVYLSADLRKHQTSAPLAFVRGIHRGPVNSPHKGPVTRKMVPFDDVITTMAVYDLIPCVAFLGRILVKFVKDKYLMISEKQSRKV